MGSPEYQRLPDLLARQELVNLHQRQQRVADLKLRVQTRQMQLELQLRRLQRELERVSEKIDLLLDEHPGLEGKQ